jgi:hypothetical protein
MSAKDGTWAAVLTGVYAAYPGTWREDAASSQLRPVTRLLKDSVPADLRAELWRAAVGNRLGLFEDIFVALLDDANGSGVNFKEKEKRKAMVQTDLERTFPAFGAMFSGESSPYAEALSKVLTAYARLHPEVGEVGYVQGMSYLVAMVLMHGDVNGMCDEIWPIFVTVTNLLEDTILLPLLQMEAVQLDRLFRFWNECLKSYLPDLASHFEELGLEPPMYLVDWIFTCYCKVLTPDMAVWVWDRLLLSPPGDLYLIKAGLGLLRVLRQECLSGDLGDCMQLLHKAHPADGEPSDQLHKAIDQAKVSSRSWEKFKADLGHVEELEASPRAEPPGMASGGGERGTEMGRQEFEVVFSELKPIGMNVMAGGEVGVVHEGTPAATAGVLAGDFVVAIDGLPVSAGATETEMQGLMGGRPIPVVFRRAMFTEPEPQPAPVETDPRPLEDRISEKASRWKGKFSTRFTSIGKQISEAAEEAAAITATALSEVNAQVSVARANVGTMGVLGGTGDVFERICTGSEADNDAPTKLGIDLGLHGGVVSVVKVEPGSYAEREWNLNPGLELLSANSRLVSTMGFEELMQMVRVERPLQLEFRDMGPSS